MPIIYEFSTGIKEASYDKSSGRWLFNGYDIIQPYKLNSFPLDQSVKLGAAGIPQVIDTAIRNDYFDIKPGHTSLAVAGRYLDDGWAVLAVASYLSDAARVYRYFCCQGYLNQNIDSMLTLIDWYIQQKPGLRFEPMPDRQPIPFEWGTPTLSNAELLNQNERTVLGALKSERSRQIPQVSLNLSELKTIISNLSHSEKKSFSWARGVVNFEALVDSGKFRLVQSAQNQLSVIKKPIEDINPASRLIDTNSLRATLNDLASDSPSDVKRLVQKLLCEDVKELEWERIFENIGLPRLDNSSSPSPTSIRLLTLQAILVPKTITALISLIKESVNQKKQKVIQVVQKFENKLLDEIVIAPYQQQDINNFLVQDKLLNNLYEGIWLCLNNPGPKEYNVKILTKYQGLWNFVLRSWVAIDFYNYFNKTPLSSQAKTFFDALDSRTSASNSGIDKSKIYKYLLSLWCHEDPVITAFYYQKLFEPIPIKIYNQIEKTKYWDSSIKQEKYVWKDYIARLNLSKPHAGVWQ